MTRDCKERGLPLRILLVAPDPNAPRRKKAWYVPFPQASLPLIAALTPTRHEVRIIDERIEDVNFDDTYDLVGITVMSATAIRAYQIADAFRERGVKVVLGGIHPTALPEEAKKHADSVVIGEAENVWEKLLEDCEKGNLQPFYRGDTFPSLSGLPHSRLDLLRGRYLLKHVFQTTRGCPHACGFCSVSTFMGRRYRHRPVEEVVEEIAQYPVRMIGFLDDNIVGNPAYSRELFQALIPLRKKWVSQGTLRMAEDEKLLRLAAQSGCIALFVGFESVNEENLKDMHKSFHKVDQYRKLVERFHKHGIMVIGSFVFGFDEDDTSVFYRTLRFIEDTKIDFAQFSILTPLPGTEVFEKFKAQGRIFSFDWSKYDFAHVVYQPAKMTPEELQEGYNLVFREFYSLPRIAKRLFRNWRYLHYFLPASLYYHWVASHPKGLPEKCPDPLTGVVY
ncbi:MAG: B12-binding domain-containing radical SAM protein [Candidatus Caldatribacterium sp.]|uniref:B12-binding domain-containing radical SAM protein n=1 Tax=Candidatus Caldatribacterium sp. TaxID=2282143 RepID=UPI00299BD120|nr:B12-binding domain-containing radical SAM protein [Candidatus Caldatribacterium sp.]MCX7730927.1 B12-binding domain-containing radical SAM protein [Candidatus Caldatribacterium sp.]MDW8081435.1 radical SAM protein [Candidatus Calescibacterium sp.]